MMKKIFAATFIVGLMLQLPTAQANSNYQLQIKFQKSASAKVITWTLTCRPAAGNHPAVKAACAELRVSAAALKPVPRNTACTMIYGGEQKATISGRWAGKSVKAKFNRTNGCEIDRWDKLAVTLSGKPR